MAKGAIYGRVSSDEQEERGTIESQVQYAKKYMELHGAEMGIDDYEFYLDEGVSGTLPLAERPAASKLVADAKGGKFKVLYVYRLDRLARSVKHVLDTYDLLESKGIVLKSMTEAFDTSTPTGKFFMTLLASIAALERDTIMERTLLGKERCAREGKWVSGPPPFGYRSRNGYLEIQKEEAETIKLIYRLYVDGMSTIDVAEYLNARDIPTPSKSKGNKFQGTGKWSAGHISIILRTEAYMGKYKYLRRSKRKKEVIPIDIPCIINNEAFASVQTKLKEHSDNARSAKGSRNYLLRGIIYCGNCGRAMVGSSGQSKEGRVYYRCTNHNTGDGKKCNAKMVRATEIENAVWNDIVMFIKHPGKLKTIMEKQIKKNAEDITPVKNELAEVEQALLDKQAARGRVVSLNVRGIISDAEAERELKNLASEIEALTARKDSLFKKTIIGQESEVKTLTAGMLLERFGSKIDSLADEEKAELIKGLVKRIDVYTDIIDGKKESRVNIKYIFGLGLSVSADTQNHTTVLPVETVWMFQGHGHPGKRVDVC